MQATSLVRELILSGSNQIFDDIIILIFKRFLKTVLFLQATENIELYLSICQLQSNNYHLICFVKPINSSFLSGIS